jgi:hypothetical protein
MRRDPSLLRRVLAPLAGFAVLTGVFMAGPVGAHAADPTPSPTGDTTQGGAPPQTPGTAICTLSDTRLATISGLAATADGYLAVDNGTTSPTSVRIYHLDTKCKVTSTDIRSKDPRDPTDLAVGSDGATYVADFGDAEGNRPTIAMFKVGLGADITIFRMSYPDGNKDGRAMLLDHNNMPIVLTLEPGVSGIYVPKSALKPEIPAPGVALRKVGSFTPERTDTANPKGQVGAGMVTGAAVSPDGTKVVIRTASDAYEWDVPDGDIVKAITQSQPRRTPLPNEPDGEAITYSADGQFFLTASAKQGATAGKILRYKPYVPVAAKPTSTGGPGEDNSGGGTGQSWLDRLTFTQLTRIVAAIGVVGLVLAIAGIIGIRRARRRRREEEEYDDYDDYDAAPPRRRGRGDEYGAYGAGYDQYSGNGYEGGGYPAGASYGPDPYQQGNGYGGYADPGYADPGYGQQPAGSGYAGAPPYGGEYGGAGQYTGYDPNYGGQYGGGYDQNYGGQYGQQHGGYDEFDPLQDPRRH